MIEVNCQVSIKKSGVCFLDETKVELLKEIKMLGSLSAAAKKMKISYQHAWTLITEMNRIAPTPLVDKQRGGSKGGGAEITSYGDKILSDYSLIEAQLKNLVSRINVEINL